MSSTAHCKKTSSLYKKTCHRKKPKGAFNHTWSASTYKTQLQQQCTFNLTSASNYIISTLPIETRIDLYEKKYQVVMESESKLSSWVKSTRERAPPPPKLLIQTQTATKSRLPDFLFASLSTRPKRKNQLHLDSSPIAKSSISTFLRKASDTLATSYSKQPSKCLQINSKLSATSNQPHNHRFSLTSSLNRLSLSRNSCSSIIISEEPSNLLKNEIKPSLNDTKSKYKRLSTPQQPQNVPVPPVQQQQQQPRKKALNYSLDLAAEQKKKDITKKRPQSSILPQSSSSIFLERLRSRSPVSNNASKLSQQTVQPNIISQSHTYNSNSSIGTMDEDTPPSSPSSIDSVPTPPPTPHNGHHLYNQQRNKRRSQELLFHHAITAAKPKHSLTMMANITEYQLLEQQEEKTVLTSQTSHTGDINNNNKCIPAAALLTGGNNSVINTTATTTTTPNQQHSKKKRASLLITPSLSTIRLLSQKSQFLKRQSMLA